MNYILGVNSTYARGAMKMIRPPVIVPLSWVFPKQILDGKGGLKNNEMLYTLVLEWEIRKGKRHPKTSIYLPV